MNREVLRSVRAPERIVKLARGEPEESENASRTRILKLARELYGPAEEGNPDAIKILSTLSDGDRELYRRARRNVLDKEEREVILAHPQLIRDKAERIERLSALRWGTPCAEVEALILATLRGNAYQPVGSTPGHAGTEAASPVERFSLLPELSEDGPDQ